MFWSLEKKTGDLFGSEDEIDVSFLCPINKGEMSFCVIKKLLDTWIVPFQQKEVRM